MKVFYLFIFLFLSVNIYSTKRALLIGVGNYPKEAGWDQISSVNDLNLLSPILVQKGFEVKILENESATKKGIISSLIQLIRKSKTGDQVIIHFSCHGQQMEDSDGDEPDGLDESMIPYDARRFYIKSKYTGQNHLKDDELNIYLTKLRIKLGNTGSLFVSLDACHSGDGTRDFDFNNDDEIYFGNERGVSDIFSSNPHLARTKGSKERNFVSSIKNASPMYVLSACAPDQRSFEYKDKVTRKSYGFLSYLLSIIMKDCNDADFRDWLNDINHVHFVLMKYQHPQIQVYE